MIEDNGHNMDAIMDKVLTIYELSIVTTKSVTKIQEQVDKMCDPIWSTCNKLDAITRVVMI